MFKEIGEESLTTLILLGTIIVVFFVAFVVLLAYLFTARKNKLIQEKQLMKTQFEQELLQTQIEIQEQTLRTISQEIHDNVGQVLSLAKLNLNTVGNITDQQLQSKIDSTKTLVSKAIKDLRDLSRSLHGEKTGEIGLQEAIANELKIIHNTGQFVTELQVTGHVYKQDPQKEMVLFRIVQEALHNAVKHSNAKQLKVMMNYTASAFTLTINDDGIGFIPEQLSAATTGIGLKNMRNRASLIGGEIAINSPKNNGTSIIVELPYQNI
ncbi:MAG TPA: sensor histidine kinase [Ferruginibacter sp.]|nr:sensor histidine kinase [Ferruginibacter sp.]